MQDLKPHIDALKSKHAGDKKKLAQAQMDLYKEHGVNPAAGCLPLLISFPIFIALYQVFWQILGNGNISGMTEQINKIVYFPFLKINQLDPYFFGLNLANKPSSWQANGWWLLMIPVITAGLYLIQSKMMAPPKSPVKKEDKAKEKGGEMEEAMSSLTQGPMMTLLPVMFGFFAYSFPIGLSLYWNTFTLLAIVQQYYISGWGGLSKIHVKQ